MPLSLIFALQAAATPVDGSIDFDLAKYRASETEACREDAGAAPDAIVVCGRRLNDRIDPTGELARRYTTGPLRAETRLFGNVTGRAFAESAPMPRGAVAKRVMVGIKLPF